MMTLVFFLEEPSAEEMLRGILPNILPDHVVTRFIVFEGKQDMEKQLKRRLKFWQAPNSRFFVMRDQDSRDCRSIKQNLLELCEAAHKPETIVRIACHELESFYIGDLNAVEKGLGVRNLAKLQNKRKFREPDALSHPGWELKNLTKNRYQKVSGSRAIGKHLDIENNLSHSFNVLVSAIKHVAVSDCGSMHATP